MLIQNTTGLILRSHSLIVHSHRIDSSQLSSRDLIKVLAIQMDQLSHELEVHLMVSKSLPNTPLQLTTKQESSRQFRLEDLLRVYRLTAQLVATQIDGLKLP